MRPNERFSTLSLLQVEPNVGYALGTSNPKPNPNPNAKPNQQAKDVTTDPAGDMAYKAMWSVTKATLALAAQLQENENLRRMVLFPVIAIRGQLFEAPLHEDGEITVTEIKRGQVDWSHPASSTGRVLIDIVTEDAIEDFADDVKAAVEAMREHGVETARDALKAFELEQAPTVNWIDPG
jgi:translation elongation factor EF-Ts